MTITVPAEQARAIITGAAFKNEAQFSEHLRKFFKSLDLLAYHTHRSDFSAAGFPDWIIHAGDWGFALELKYGKNKPTDAQLRWIAAFNRMPNWYATVLYPARWPLVRDNILEKFAREKR